MDSKVSSTGGWKTRLERFHREGIKTDYYGGQYDPSILASAIRILQGGDALVYPAKSFIVAICYADHIAHCFCEELRTVLSYPQLLHDDAHYVPYNDDNAVLYETLIPMVLCDTFRASELYGVIMGYCKEELR